MPNSDGAAPQPPQEETPSPSFWAYWCGCLGSQVAEKDKKNAIAYIKNDEHLEYSAYNVEGNEKHALTLEEAMANLPKISRRLESLQKEPTNESEHINIAQNDALINQTIENIQTILIHINDQRYILPIQNAINEATKYLGTKTIPIDIINKLNEACQEAQRLAATGPHYGQSSSANIPGVVYDATQPKEKLEQYSEEELKKIMDNVFKKFNFKDFMTGYDIKIDNETANFLTQFGVEIGVQKGQKVANLSIA
ncbi:hypothetical protein N9X24_01200, partial [Rickettsiales bacterium]|nr:hypothetical protein [Rickettsiales bacterium]